MFTFEGFFLLFHFFNKDRLLILSGGSSGIFITIFVCFIAFRYCVSHQSGHCGSENPYYEKYIKHVGSLEG